VTSQATSPNPRIHAEPVRQPTRILPSRMHRNKASGIKRHHVPDREKQAIETCRSTPNRGRCLRMPVSRLVYSEFRELPKRAKELTTRSNLSYVFKNAVVCGVERQVCITICGPTVQLSLRISTCHVKSFRTDEIQIRWRMALACVFCAWAGVLQPTALQLERRLCKAWTQSFINYIRVP
jgi:hypothetical protein